ncbi:MAG: putative PurR-regulated permease PerM [Thermoproteota archaeon]
MEDKKISYIFFFAIFILLFYISFLMMTPFLGPMIFAGILAGTFLPFQNYMRSRFRINREKAAVITCLVIFLIVVIPAVYIIYQLSRESAGLYNNIKGALTEQEVNNFLFGDGFFAKGISFVNEKFSLGISTEMIQEKIIKFAQLIIQGIAKNINGVINNLLSFVMNFLIMFVAIWGYLSQGHLLKRFVFELSPLDEKEEELILNKFNQMNFVSIYCNGLGGLIQGAVAGLCFYFVGISSVFFWTTLMVVLAFIPLIGMSVVYIPASIYLWVKGRILAAVLLFVICTLVALWVENVFKPKFIGARVQVNSLILLLFILGGISYFGMAGIFYGPVICILLLTLIDLYHEKYKKIESSEPCND